MITEDYEFILTICFFADVIAFIVCIYDTIFSGVFLMLTIIIEMPIVYNALKKQVQDRKVLKVVIIVSNIITTAGVAIVERLITEGYWA